MRVTGVVLDIEHKAGSFTNDQGGNVNYDFTVLHVLEGRAVVKVRLPDDIHVLDLPFSKGEEVDMDVTAPEGTKYRYVGVCAAV